MYTKDILERNDQIAAIVAYTAVDLVQETLAVVLKRMVSDSNAEFNP